MPPFFGAPSARALGFEAIAATAPDAIASACLRVTALSLCDDGSSGLLGMSHCSLLFLASWLRAADAIFRRSGADIKLSNGPSACQAMRRPVTNTGQRCGPGSDNVSGH